MGDRVASARKRDAMGLIDVLAGMSKRLLGTTNEALLKGYLPFARQVNEREGAMRAADDATLGRADLSNLSHEAELGLARKIAEWPRLVEIAVADHDNRIYVGGGGSLSAAGLRAAVRANELLAPTLPRLRFRSPAR